MRGSIRIARLLGINIYLDWSLIFIFLLLVWNLGWSVFPTLHPEWGSALDITVSVFAAIVFFLSILAHELAHSIVANTRGLPVRRITLLIFGGVSDIEREPTSPMTEFLMAFVGPLTSIILGIVFLLLGGSGLGARGINFSNPSQSLAGLSPVNTLLLWLGPINIILGIFNLIPAFPLDGGRVFRSILWGISHNLQLATRWAAIVGQIIAWVFIVVGIAMVFGISVPFFGTGVISGLWLAFIGWFLNSAAIQSYRQVLIEDILTGVPVSRLMRPSLTTVPPSATIDDLMDHYVLGTDDRAFPVVENNRILGMICIEDIRKVPRTEWNTTAVSTIMTPASQLETISSKEDASVAFNKIAGRDIGQIPVIDNGQIVGLLRRQDIVRYLQIASNTMSSRTS